MTTFYVPKKANKKNIKILYLEEATIVYFRKYSSTNSNLEWQTVDVSLPPNCSCESLSINRLPTRTLARLFPEEGKENDVESLLLPSEYEIQRDLGRCTLS